MAVQTPNAVLSLHGVRIQGFTTPGKVAARFGLDAAEVAEQLEDFRAYGWVTWSEFAGTAGWSLTDRGRSANERQLAAELESTGARAAVQKAYDEFLLLNARVLRACTNWQVRPTRWDDLAPNDHTDWRWDERVLTELAAVGRRLATLSISLCGVLHRFAGYDVRFAAALARVDAGQRSWIDSTSVDSCHTVWFQLHEDLLATLGIQRGDEGRG